MFYSVLAKKESGIQKKRTFTANLRVFIKYKEKTGSIHIYEDFTLNLKTFTKYQNSPRVSGF